jgi:hypothetical protein
MYMSGYGDVKRSRLLNLVKRLENKKGIFLKPGSKHCVRVECIHNGSAYPLPVNHNKVNKYIVKDFQEWLERNGICCKDEFDSLL